MPEPVVFSETNESLEKSEIEELKYRSMHPPYRIPFLVLMLVFIISCQEESVSPGTNNNSSPNSSTNTDWLVPIEKIIDGGPGRDGIPSIDLPQFIPATSATYVRDDELIVGLKGGQTIKAYPHKILDWHEIVNDEIDGVPVSVIYCPLTGTGTAWSRMINGAETTFGVSGLIYQNNIIPYDRLTLSNWTQLGNQCIQGQLATEEPERLQLIETTWGRWKELYPETMILSDRTGFNRNYDFYPYFDYRENSNKYSFPLYEDDARLPRKDRVLGVVVDDTGPRAGGKVYPLEVFGDSVRVIQEFVKGNALVIAGSNESYRDFAVCYHSKVNNETLNFTPVQNKGEIIMEDESGSEWNLYGKAVSGPLEGTQLVMTFSFIGYWFGWGEFYPGIEIYGQEKVGGKEVE